jgi:RAB protein geranylgeranyltransferase component A
MTQIFWNFVFDCVICGTGINECIVSALLAKKGFKILQVDRND